ncbi:MAG TPA: hypothetical protein VF595_00475 [Tepidisphaeraceae bacterium]|jgi:hypothetical protein
MIPQTEARISPKSACADPRVRRDGRAMSLATYYRWITFGARDAAGVRVLLETVQTPMGKCTTREAIGRFLDRLNGVHVSSSNDSASTPAADAMAELAAAGIR